MAKNLLHRGTHWYLEELKYRVVAESGKPSDRYHLGKLILQSFKDYPDAIAQIDGASGKSVINKQLMEKCIKCATCFRNMGLQVGDKIVIMSPSNLDISVPFYAALFTGVIIAAVDHLTEFIELKNKLNLLKPKVIFSYSERIADIKLVLKDLQAQASVISFDKGENLFSLEDFIDRFNTNVQIQDFKVTDLDASTATALLISTSGTTGVPELAITTHKSFAISIAYLWSKCTKFPSPVEITLIIAPLRWVTTILQYIATPIYKVTRLESSAAITNELVCQLINTYKPTFFLVNASAFRSLITFKDKCDFTCFKLIHLGGTVVTSEQLQSIQEVASHAEIQYIFGMTELSGSAFHGTITKRGPCSMPMDSFLYRLVDPDTAEEIFKPDIPGELWLKGPTIFKGYYKNEAATAGTFAEDGWFKTGDLFYRDEDWNYYFVDRIKLLIKYKSHQVSPIEIENVIRTHPGVSDVAVTSIRDEDCGDLPVAGVVLRKGYNDIAEEIKQLVKDSLADFKRLRGGVVFLNDLPKTTTAKVNRRKLKELAQALKKY